ncbi:uncharacterized protein LOC108674436 isoform X2 [Hyalella azteca]|uniref:Uncharacterized protein LOC108674436 isoform X2 n=1 Tax=Hyalella azteca TaxID=294128 RepID=A0A8B7NVS2_HYAAZ|nr:uncharacterized protein LOC108674436 isoform X2 [Hyalella azteca]
MTSSSLLFTTHFALAFCRAFTSTNMMKSVGLVLLLIATFAYSSVEGSNCGSSVAKAIYEKQVLKDALNACKSDRMGSAALTALAAQATCKDYEFNEANGGKCDEVAAPYMKCVAGKLGYLNYGGSIHYQMIFDQYKSYAVARGTLCKNQYDNGVRVCGTTISNYAFLGKAGCIINAMYQSG